jgi:hypothetical protein
VNRTGIVDLVDHCWLIVCQLSWVNCSGSLEALDQRSESKIATMIKNVSVSVILAFLSQNGYGKKSKIFCS